MFNYAKDRMPPEFQQERLLHMQRLVQGREKAIQDDAKHLALVMSQEGKTDPDEVMEHVQYWQFVRRYDRKFYDSVRSLAIELIPEIKNIVPLVPSKQPPMGAGGGGPGGPPPGAAPGPQPQMPIASSSRMTKTAFMYLIREDGKPHKLMGSFAGDIIMGRQQYIDANGKAMCLRIKRDGNISVPTNSPSAIEANRIQRELPDEIIRTISSALVGKAKNRGELALATFNRAKRTKVFDLLPVSLAIFGPSKTILMLYRAKNSDHEPEEATRLRTEIGKVMAPYMTRLKKALLEDGFDFVESPSPLPRYVPQDAEAEHNDYPPPTSAIRMLGKKEIESSKDFRSLLMTAVSNKDDDALARLAIVMARYPGQAHASGVCSQDLSHLASIGEHGPAVVAMSRCMLGDDADVMEAYVEGDDFTKACISQLVSAQDRLAIMSAMPEMCAEGWLNVEFFSRLDVMDARARKVIEDVASKSTECPSGILGLKLMELVANNFPNPQPRNRHAALFEATLLAEQGQDPSHLLAEIRPHNSDAGAITAMVCAKFVPMPAKPDRISMLFGKRKALEYMRLARVNWEGDGIPMASDIMSAPDNPLPLARGLADIQDTAGMLTLLHKCAENGQPKSEESKEAIRVLLKALAALGHSKDAYAILNKFGVAVEQNEEPSGSLDDILRMIRAGDDVGAALALCKEFESDPEGAVTALNEIPPPNNPKLFLEMLPSGLIATSSPEWAMEWIQTRTHAILLPYGLKATCTAGVYTVSGRHIASSSAMALSACSTALAQGLGMLPAENQVEEMTGDTHV